MFVSHIFRAPSSLTEPKRAFLNLEYWIAWTALKEKKNAVRARFISIKIGLYEFISQPFRLVHNSLFYCVLHHPSGIHQITTPSSLNVRVKTGKREKGEQEGQNIQGLHTQRGLEISGK